MSFDKYSKTYTETLDKQSHITGDRSKFNSQKADLVKKYSSSPQDKILEFGCGIGNNLRYINQTFPTNNVFGFDVSKESIVTAKSTLPNTFFDSLGDLLKANIKFDLILISCVFHHIPPKDRATTLLSLKQLLSNKGKILIVEHNPINPLTQYLVKTCELDDDAILLFKHQMKKLITISGFKTTAAGYFLFFPFVTSLTKTLEKLLFFFPLGGQYFITAEPNHEN